MAIETAEHAALNEQALLDSLVALRRGDFSTRLPAAWTGRAGRIADVFNDVVDLNQRMAAELGSLSDIVGRKGHIQRRASLGPLSGSWATMVDSVNSLVTDLIRPTSELARVVGAVAAGDLTQSISLEVDDRPLRGEFLRTAKIVNTMVNRLSAFTAEVTRVSREVSAEGKLGEHGTVRGVSGVWKDLTDNINEMVANLSSQVRNIAEVTTAVASGDLSKKVTVDVRGEFLELKETINTMVDQLSSFAAEVTRVAREVGSEGKLGGQAHVKGVAGTWKDLTDSVNGMASNLTVQLRDVSKVSTAIANGDLTQKITVDVRGEMLQIKNVINTMVDQLGSFASEVTRVAREVGTEGKLGGQADVKGVAGTWKDLTDSVNGMAANLTSQVRNIAEVTTAVANGDLSKKITVNVRGEILQLKDTINTMVDQLSSFAAEVTRVAREVGTEGKLGGQADVKDVAGTWKDLTDSVNGMAANLTNQVRNIAEVTTAVAKGDLSKKITVDVRGEILQLKDTVNTMVDQLSSFAAEVTRVAREVGSEGKLGGQAEVRGVSGTWKDLTDSVNRMAANLTSQVRNIADVTTAVAKGVLSRKITVNVQGEFLELKETINTMVDQLNSFAAEVTRVAREVGTEGNLGGQADVKGVAGTWKDLTDSVNGMAANLTSQVRNIAEVTTAVATGNLSKKITVNVQGEILQLKDTINTMVDQLSSFAAEVTRVAREVGTDGKLGGQAEVKGVAGTWKDLTDSVNGMAANLTSQVRNIAEVTTAVARGDLSKKITVDVRGEILQLKDTVNTMVDQLSSFAAEVTRVAREVGTQGKLGGQAVVKGVSGTWKDLTDNANLMAANLTSQVRGIARVVTAVANGDLKQNLVLTAEGEIAELADTINSMTNTLATFAEQVTTVAREVGVEGRLGGQASVPGAAGTWRDLTDNVNQLAANLTTQVRAIAEVATAVTKGDLTRSIGVEARGEVAILKDNINEMIRNLRETTQKNSEQDWLKTNLTKFTRMLQGQRDLVPVTQLILNELAPVVSAQHGAFYIVQPGENPRLTLLASYAYTPREHVPRSFAFGEGLVGQVAVKRERIVVSNVPPEYIKISSGLGEASPVNIIVLPILFEGQLRAVLELASFGRFGPTDQTFLEQLAETIGIVLNTIEANMRTEALLTQSQSLAQELQYRQEELQKTNAELENQARLLGEQNAEVEKKNREVELAKAALEEKAEQLALTSKYKSEFLSNMSHELRTPLNSLLILSKQLADNPHGNLNQRQVEFARTIHTSGSDLLTLINDILDLSKIESGTVTIDLAEVLFDDIRAHTVRTFRHVAEGKNLPFSIELDHSLPASLYTDSKRLLQVLKNLLANAFKFTRVGSVTLDIRVVTEGWTLGHSQLSNADEVVAFAVRDTGIGIPPDKQKVIFEAFQQADGSTSRKYGGTGLGLSISREISRLLGGEITLESVPGEGSVFTLYLPRAHVAGTPNWGGLSSMADGVARRERRALELHNDAGPADAVVDDRDRLGLGERPLLIIEDDPVFARILVNTARERGLKAVVAQSAADGIQLAARLRPAGIALDLHLPDGDGWEVVERLRRHPDSSAIPIHVITGEERDNRYPNDAGVMFLRKPVSHEDLSLAFANILSDPADKRVLIVEDDDVQREDIVQRVLARGLAAVGVATGAEALMAVDNGPYDAVVVDLSLPDMSGRTLIERLRSNADCAALPIIVHTARDLSPRETSRIKRSAQSVIHKDPRSPDRLLDEVRHFLTQVAQRSATVDEPAALPVDTDRRLAGRKVLVVDDDVRNIFALSGLLERHEMQVIPAENGRDAISKLRQTSDIEIILMDIMMPEMDGYETMRAIRREPKYATLPIIAITAKAMRGDREKCIDAGATDYVSKPVDDAVLLSVLRMQFGPTEHSNQEVPA